MKNKDLTIEQLLKLFPNGFSVNPIGGINKTLFATSHFTAIAAMYPMPPSDGGYLVVEMVDDDFISGYIQTCP